MRDRQTDKQTDKNRDRDRETERQKRKRKKRSMVELRTRKKFLAVNEARLAIFRTTPVLQRQDPNTRRLERMVFFFLFLFVCVCEDETQCGSFRGNRLYEATKRHLNNSQTVKNDEK